MKKFKSVTGKPVRIALVGGHITYVGVEFQTLNERFHLAAYSNGCISDDMVKNQAAAAIPTKMAEDIVENATKVERILEKISEWVATNQVASFSEATGKPDARLLSDALDMRVSSHERDEAWYKYQESTETE